MDRDFLWPHLLVLPYFRAVLRAVEARILQSVELPPPTLDIGSGDGHFASVAFDRRLDVGIDPSMEAAREAQRHDSYDLLLLSDGACMPHASDTFASAVSNSVLEHVDRLDQVLSEIARVLRPGAMLAFTVPNPGYRSELSLPCVFRTFRLHGLARWYENWFMRMSRTVNLYDEDQWTKRLEDAGFAVERWQRYFSPAALRALEWGHYFGAATLLPRKLTGRWILAPWRWNLRLTESLTRRYYDELPGKEGTYTFFLARKK